MRTLYVTRALYKVYLLLFFPLCTSVYSVVKWADYLTTECTEEHRGKTRKNFYSSILGIVFCFFCVVHAVAEHPIDVEYATAHGEHLKAVVTFDKLPLRIRTKESSVAAAKSAWALGLPERAVKEIEVLLQRKDLKDEERSEILLTRGIIELQEGRPQVATLFAEKSIAVCTSECRSRSRGYLVWGDALQALGSFGAAEGQYDLGLETATREEEVELLYRRALCRYKLGKLKEAKEDFEKLPLGGERTPLALRFLAEISLALGDYKATKMLLAKAQQEYPQEFLDSWVEYARAQAAIREKNLDELRSIRRTVETKYPPSDGWVTLLHAAAESFEWEISHGGTP